MCVFIKMEYIVANALCEILAQSQQDSISFKAIKEYGFQIEKYYVENKNTKAIVLFSEEYRKQFLRDYSDLFGYNEETDCIFLQKGVTIEAVRTRILAYASIDLLEALFDDKAMSVLK